MKNNKIVKNKYNKITINRGEEGVHNSQNTADKKANKQQSRHVG
jgi:hypothetical protein